VRQKSDRLNYDRLTPGDTKVDELLERLKDLAVSRGNSYVKGPSVLQELPDKLAELGVLLLEKSKSIETLRGEALRLELIEIQHKVDDLRKALFANKLLAK